MPGDGNFERDESAEAVYALHRSYIEHEDGLINQRTTWLITIQSFLIATFGFSYQKKFEVAEKLFSYNKSLNDLGSLYDEYRIFLFALALVGLITSIAAFFSVLAAARAIWSIRENWERLYGSSTHPYLPGLTGGGNKRIASRGIVLCMWAPVFFSSLWAIVIMFLLLWLRIQAGAR